MKGVNFLHGGRPLTEYVRIHANEMPEKPVVIFYGKELTWSMLEDWSNRLANAILEMGYSKGNRVAVFCQSCPQCYVIYLACLKLGLIIVPVDPMHKELELEYALNNSGAELVIVLDQLYPIVANVRSKCKVKNVIVTSYRDFVPERPAFPLHPMMLEEKKTFPDTHEMIDLIGKYPARDPGVEINISDDAWILYTGGTSGWPKGCLHTHLDALIGGYGLFHIQLDATKNDVLLTPVPHTHIYGISVGVATSFYGGLTVIVLTRWDTNAALQAITKYRVTKIAMPMPCIAGILSHPDLKKYDLRSLTTCNTIGFAIPFTRESAERWYDVTGCKLDNWGYAIGSENFNYCSYGHGVEDPFKDPAAAGVGILAPGVEIKVTDFDSRQQLPVGYEGNLTVKSAAGIKKYWNKPEETKANIVDGWIYSGDIGKIGEDGLVYYYGRKRDIIKVSGYTLAPREVEVLGLTNPAIEKIAVIGLPHPKKGEIPKAFITLKPGYNLSKEELEKWFVEHIAAYKVPIVEIRGSLPISNKGEVLKRKLKEEELAKQKQ